MDVRGTIIVDDLDRQAKKNAGSSGALNPPRLYPADIAVDF
jgi:hypothetical protein